MQISNSWKWFQKRL